MDEYGNLPLHVLLQKPSSSDELAMVIIEKYPAALQHQNENGYLPIHIECEELCRSEILSKCIELYPESLAVTGNWGKLPLHLLLLNILSSSNLALKENDNDPENDQEISSSVATSR
jgi:hypothetical protein